MDMTVEEKAFQLAEYEYNNASMTEILERAYKAIRKEWLEKARTDSAMVHEAYFNLVGGY